MNTDTYLESNPTSGIAKLVVQAQRDAALAIQRYSPIADTVREQMIRMYEEMAGPRNAMQEVVESFQKQAKLAVLDFPKLTFPVIESPSILPNVIVPAPLAITEMLTENSEAIVPLPVGAQWEFLQCCFKDEYTLTVKYTGKLIRHFDHTTLGFVRKNTKDGKPDKQWAFLHHLAVINEQRTVQPTISTLAAALETSPGGCQKIKQSALHKLRDAFGLSDNPFHNYDSDFGYRLKFALRPIPLLRGTGELHTSASKLFEETDTPEEVDEE